MVFIILVTLLVLGIAFFQAIQGFYNSVIMALLTVLTAALAFTFYEPLAAALLYTRQPSCADAVILIALFVVPLLVFRIFFDRFLIRDLPLGLWTNRIGGGIFGLISGMVLVGVLTVAVQMLPVREKFLYYRPYDDALQRQQRLAPFFPDEFTVGLMNVLSRGGLSAEADKSLRSVHDDLLLELFCARNTAGKGGRVGAPPDAMRVLGVCEPPDHAGAWIEQVPPNPLLPDADIPKLLIARVQISGDARDEDNWWRLVGTQFRLVGQSGRGYYPVAYLTYEAEGGWQAHAPPIGTDSAPIAQLIVERAYSGDTPHLAVDWVYKIAQSDEPAELIFRRVADASIRGVRTDEMPPSQGALNRTAEPPSRRRSDRRRR